MKEEDMVLLEPALRKVSNNAYVAAIIFGIVRLLASLILSKVLIRLPKHIEKVCSVANLINNLRS